MLLAWTDKHCWKCKMLNSRNFSHISDPIKYIPIQTKCWETMRQPDKYETTMLLYVHYHQTVMEKASCPHQGAWWCPYITTANKCQLPDNFSELLLHVTSTYENQHCLSLKVLLLQQNHKLPRSGYVHLFLFIPFSQHLTHRWSYKRQAVFVCQV